MISIVLVTYRRLERLGEILKAWLEQSPDVWLCDCSTNGIKVPGVNHVRFTPDPGNRVRHAVALLTSGDLVIKADDDVMPRPGLAADFERRMAELGPAILGIHGRIFHGPNYYRNTKHFGAKSVQNPLRVHFVGVVTCSPRIYLPMDLKQCATEVEDLYWQMACYPKARKYVINTDKFANLPESKDIGRLCADGQARRIRESFYRKYYQEHFSG
jgi:hypothetical protein